MIAAERIVSNDGEFEECICGNMAHYQGFFTVIVSDREGASSAPAVRWSARPSMSPSSGSTATGTSSVTTPPTRA